MRVTLDVEEDTIVQIRRSQNHENQLLSNLVSTKVAKAKQKPLEEAYSKQRVVYDQRKASIQGDPKTSKVLVSFIICNLLNNVFIIFIILGLATSHRSFARSLQTKHKQSFQEERLPLPGSNSRWCPRSS